MFDNTCIGLYNPSPSCIAANVAKQPYSIMPVCWNYNTSMDGMGSCRAPRDGTPLTFCIEVAYTSTAFIMECANQWNGDPHCGTFLEVHRVDRT